MQQDPLQELRDIQLPEPIGWWPPAPGWWILGVLILAAVLYGLWKLRRRHLDRAYRRQATAELDKAWKQFGSDADATAYVKMCNIILRRTALQRDPENRKHISPLAGEEWFDYLDSCCPKPVFAGAIKAEVFDAQYRPVDQKQQASNARSLHKAAQKWLGAHN